MSSLTRFFPGTVAKQIRPTPQAIEAPQELQITSAFAETHVQQSFKADATALTIVSSSDADSDEGLLARICNGDADALSCLFHRYARIVRAVAYRVLRDISEADDVLQDIFLLIHRSCKAFDSSKSPARFWILQMTYHRAISRRRYLDSRHFYKQVDLDDVAKELPEPSARTGRYEDSIDGVLGNGGLEKLFAELSEGQRQTLRLYFFEGYTFAEIAAKLDQTRGNIKHHYFRGLEKLRKHIFGSKLTGK